MTAGPRQHQDRMTHRPAPQPAPAVNLGKGRPAFHIEIRAADGTVLLSLREENGCLVAEGDESRWREAARRFVHEMMQWSGQVGIAWRDEAARGQP